MKKSKTPPSPEKLEERAKQIKWLYNMVDVFKNSEEASEFESFNEWLIAKYKAETTKKQFKTFALWQQKGFFVKKGETSNFICFSQPICPKFEADTEKQDNQEDPQQEGLTKQYFKITYLFHEGQVEKQPKTKKPKK